MENIYCFLNNDIEPTYGWLNEMVGAIVNNEDVASVGAKLVFPFYEDNRRKSFKIQHSGGYFCRKDVSLLFICN